MWWRTSNFSPLLIYRPREDERLSWPGWLTYSGRLTNISGHPSATGRAQDGERTLVRDWRSTAEPRGPTSSCRSSAAGQLLIITTHPILPCTHFRLWPSPTNEMNQKPDSYSAPPCTQLHSISVFCYKPRLLTSLLQAHKCFCWNMF